jgi:precorrin-2/cobalt-factor-2 C20-methyltransferase
MSGGSDRVLIGVGVGPGDPELLTVRAVRVLREADVVFVPSGSAAGSASRAEQIVLAATGVKARRLAFALDDQGGVTAERAAAWDAAAREVLAAFEDGAGTVAFATLGDPLVYSTFGYLAQTVTTMAGLDDAAPDNPVRVEAVPGITAMQDLATRTGVRLAEGREPLTLVPATAGLDEVRAALAGPGTVVVYKGGRHLDELTALVEASGRGAGAVLGTDLGLPTEHVRALREQEPGRAPYFTTLIAPPVRGARGDAL